MSNKNDWIFDSSEFDPSASSMKTAQASSSITHTNQPSILNKINS
jgi:hypothetical protein